MYYSGSEESDLVSLSKQVLRYTILSLFSEPNLAVCLSVRLPALRNKEEWLKLQENRGY